MPSKFLGFYVIRMLPYTLKQACFITNDPGVLHMQQEAQTTAMPTFRSVKQGETVRSHPHPPFPLPTKCYQLLVLQSPTHIENVMKIR